MALKNIQQMLLNDDEEAYAPPPPKLVEQKLDLLNATDDLAREFVPADNPIPKKKRVEEPCNDYAHYLQEEVFGDLLDAHGTPAPLTRQAE